MKMNEVKQLKRNDQLICANGKEVDEFSVFATVLENNKETQSVTLARSIKHGTLQMSNATLRYQDVAMYYEESEFFKSEIETPDMELE